VTREENLRQEHSGDGDNAAEKNEENKSSQVGRDNNGYVITGDGNTIYVKDDHVILEDYNQADKQNFNQIFPFDDKSIGNIYIEPLFQLTFYTAACDQRTEKKLDKTFLETTLNLLETQNYIYLVGHYGVGKSLLLKNIYNAIPSSYDKYFIEIKEIVDPVFAKRIAIEKSEKLKIFIIDGLDEINIDNTKFNKVIEDLIKISNAADIKFIFSTRLYINTKEDIFLSLVGEYAYLINDPEIPFIEICYFERKMIEIWLEKYYPNDDRFELILKDIEKVDKRLYAMSQIPIFLYQLSYYFYKENLEKIKIKEIYKIYKIFIDATIRGKFLGKHVALNDKDKYKIFLMKIAVSILNKNYKKNNFKKYTENINNQFKDNQFTISQEDVENIVNQMDIGIKGTDVEKVNNAINCYFFEKVDYDFWVFSNINILLYLVSEYYFHIVRRWLQSVDIKKGFKLYIDKTIFEYLIQLLCSSEYESLYSRLVKMIDSSIDFNNELTDFEYFMGVLYISYDGDKPKLPFILDKIYAYSKSKYDDENYLFLLYSSFQSVYIDDIEFINIDFSNFNFSYSKLKDVTFKDCTFSKETTFTDVSFDDICFDNCILRNTTLKNIVNSNISFLNCTLNGVHIEGVEKSSIKVEGENSQIVRLELHKLSKSVDIKFMNIENGQSLIIKDSKASFKFTNAVFDKVNIVHSTIHLKEENCKLGIEKEGNSKIINE